MLPNRSNLPLCQVSMFNTSPISTMQYYCANMQTILIIPLEEIDRNCLQLSYELFLRLIHISLTFSERDVATALSYSDKNHFEASIPRKTNFKSSIWKTAPFSKTPCKLSSRPFPTRLSPLGLRGWSGQNKMPSVTPHPHPHPTAADISKSVFRQSRFPFSCTSTRLHELQDGGSLLATPLPRNEAGPYLL